MLDGQVQCSSSVGAEGQTEVISSSYFLYLVHSFLEGLSKCSALAKYWIKKIRPSPSRDGIPGSQQRVSDPPSVLSDPIHLQCLVQNELQSGTEALASILDLRTYRAHLAHFTQQSLQRLFHWPHKKLDQPHRKGFSTANTISCHDCTWFAREINSRHGGLVKIWISTAPMQNEWWEVYSCSPLPAQHHCHLQEDKPWTNTDTVI